MSIKDKPLKKCHSDARITLDVIHGDILQKYKNDLDILNRQILDEDNIEDIDNIHKKIKLGERNKKVQPGTWNSNKQYKNIDCDEIIEKVQKDFSNIRINKLNGIDDDIVCTNYKIALVIDNSGSEIDYHFYRQDINGKWSHKMGNNEITNLDASGNIISNPELADRNYDKMNNDQYNYDIFCGYYSVPYI